MKDPLRAIRWDFQPQPLSFDTSEWLARIQRSPAGT